MIGYQSLISLFIGGILLPETFAYSSTYYQYKRSSVDSGSYSNIEVARMNHFELITAVNFDKQQIEGLQTIFFDAIQDVSELVLDIQGLNISRCTYQIPNPSDPTKPGFFEANYDIFADTKMNTNGLIIYMTDKLFKGSKFSVQITYTTRNDSVSVNWLKPEQTASKTLPYMYSKCTAIHCRSLAPLQDSPSVKVTYAGAVSVKDMFRANMSAPYVSEESNTPGYMTYHFQTYNFIPPYLLALAVGNLTSKSVGYRTNVISEPNVIDDYAEVFSGLESILNETEKYMTPVPYLWGNYTVLVQPPSFPVGGMENPLLTFVSPSIMQKDKSQVFVAAHEIAHSWSGNLVTQRDWHNLWINEGMTVFIERKVSSRIHSPDFAKIENYLGNLTVWDDINSFGKDSQDSSLYPTIGNNPDSSYSQLYQGLWLLFL